MNESPMLKYFDQHADFMRTTVQPNIDRFRKGTLKLRLTDREGKPVSGAVLRAEQKTHDFKFGANIFMLDEMETPEKNANYREKFASLFNLATLPFYWCDLEPEEGKPRFAKDSPKVYRRPAPDLCLEFCREHGIFPKLHCLNYDKFSPRWLAKYSKDEIREKLRHRIQEIAARYGSQIDWLEVINETLTPANPTPVFPPERMGTPLFEDADIVEWSFAEARKVLPTQKLIINEAGEPIWLSYCYERSPYYMQIARALERGASIDSVGAQFHLWGDRKAGESKASRMFNPLHLYQVMDTYQKLGLPMQVTETTMPCYEGTAEDEAVQAEVLKNLYTVLFSHPVMESVIYWNVADGYAYGAVPGDMSVGENVLRGGLLHFDGTPKPAYLALKKLIHEEWHTSETLHTDETGRAALHGFFGDYDLTVAVGGKTYPLSAALRKAQEGELTLSLPQ